MKLYYPDSIDISCPPGAQQQTRRSGMQRSIDGTDGRTDTVLLHRPCRLLCEKCLQHRTERISIADR